MLSKKYSLDYLTIEDCANSAKNEFIMINSIYEDNDINNPIFDKDIHSVSYAKFNDIASNIASNIISIDEYKSVARSEQWKSIWNSNKNNLFNKKFL
jgi:hypothetical protein